MSRRGVTWLACCAVAPWLAAGVWTILDGRAHLIDRAIRALAWPR